MEVSAYTFQETEKQYQLFEDPILGEVEWGYRYFCSFECELIPRLVWIAQPEPAYKTYTYQVHKLLKPTEKKKEKILSIFEKQRNNQTCKRVVLPLPLLPKINPRLQSHRCKQYSVS